MKVQITVITELGTYNGDVVNGIKDDGVEEARQLLKKGHDLAWFQLHRGSETIFFPGEVIQKSILILDVQEDENEI